MINTFKEIESSALNLPESQRGKLASRLIRSLEDYSDKLVHELWLEEIDERNLSLEKGEAELISEIDVIQKARSILS